MLLKEVIGNYGADHANVQSNQSLKMQNFRILIQVAHILITGLLRLRNIHLKV
jgi:hypothetical protein